MPKAQDPANNNWVSELTQSLCALSLNDPMTFSRTQLNRLLDHKVQSYLVPQMTALKNRLTRLRHNIANLQRAPGLLLAIRQHLSRPHPVKKMQVIDLTASD